MNKIVIFFVLFVTIQYSCVESEEIKNITVKEDYDEFNKTSDNTIREESDPESEEEDATLDPSVTYEDLEDSVNRVQKVLNAFYEVTGVLAEVPRQIWMLPIRFGFYPGIKVNILIYNLFLLRHLRLH